MDSSRANEVQQNLEGVDETIEGDRVTYYRKRAARQIADEVAKTNILITATWNIHMNIAQNRTINTSSVIASFEKLSLAALSNKRMENARIHLPSDFEANVTRNTTVSLRVCFFSFLIPPMFDLSF